MKRFDIYMVGVGGQGIGLLSETLIRAADRAGIPARGVDTHGLAQRGGMVTSSLRLGEGVHSPLIRKGAARLVLALERHEALRAVEQLEEGGTLLYYDAVWQPLNVRMMQEPEAAPGAVEAACEARGLGCVRVYEELPDARMQNVALLGALVGQGLIPGVGLEHMEAALEDLLPPKVFAANAEVLRDCAARYA